MPILFSPFPKGKCKGMLCIAHIVKSKVKLQFALPLLRLSGAKGGISVNTSVFVWNAGVILRHEVIGREECFRIRPRISLLLFLLYGGVATKAPSAIRLKKILNIRYFIFMSSRWIAISHVAYIYHFTFFIEVIDVCINAKHLSVIHTHQEALSAP